jgi:RNA polymerase sigma-70 factor (ECF subfamily)
MLRLRSRALDRLRSAKAARARGLVEPLAEDYPAPPGGDPCGAVESAETQQALQMLTPVQREVIEQMYFQGLSCTEIAARCDIPAGTVKSRLSSALSRLRQTRIHDRDQD